MVDGPQFYDDDDIFKNYQKRRKRPDNPNDALEKPIILELIGNVKYADVLDLGCGAGEFGSLLFDLGCHSYTGIEASQQMVDLACQTLRSDKTQIIQSYIEDYYYPKNRYHLIVSRLALHYVEDLKPLFRQLRSALKQGGRFVFSVEHPVLTSHNESLDISGGKRENWIVDNYFYTGRRQVNWMGKDVTKYHRTVEDYFRLLQETGFTILNLRESKPKLENFNNSDEFERRHRIPLFLFFCVIPQSQ